MIKKNTCKVDLSQEYFKEVPQEPLQILFRDIVFLKSLFFRIAAPIKTVYTSETLAIVRGLYNYCWEIALKFDQCSSPNIPKYLETIQLKT